MKRRNFLSFLGGAAVAGPTAARAAASTIGMADLAPLGVNMLGSGSMGQAAVGAYDTYDHINYAKEGLKKLVGLSSIARERRKREHYFQGLDPDTASLRSISLTSKIKIAKERSFEAQERNQRSYFQGVIDGLWE